MKYLIAGLGNPGKEYEKTRHNTGRIVLDVFREKYRFSDWVEKNKVKALVSEGALDKFDVDLIEPDNFMNNSGKVLAGFIKSVKAAGRLVVIYDDIDLPLGTFKIAFDRGDGGHNGLASIIRALKTKQFIRVRVGIAPTTPTGKLKKPKGEQKILDYLMGEFKPKELDVLKKVARKVAEALGVIVVEGKEKAMNRFN